MKLILSINTREYVNEATTLVLLDFFKAFDTVDHKFLVTKTISSFNFDRTAASLVTSYIAGRTQCVAIDGIFFGCICASIPNKLQEVIDDHGYWTHYTSFFFL